MTSIPLVEAPAPHDNLTAAEAATRAELLSSLAYTVTLTLSDDPDAEAFDSATEVTFDCESDGASTFINLSAASVESVMLNGRELQKDEHGFDGHRLLLPSLRAGTNRLDVRASCRYHTDGVGLHRLADPVDGRVYVYTHFEPFDAHKVLACFDQPDLKATVQMNVNAPRAWRICGNARVTAAETSGERTTTRFNTTPPVPPYLIAVVAGPFHVIQSSHRNVPLGIWCRESLLEWVDDQVEDVLAITRQGLDFFEKYFGFPYPFDEYNQLFVPEFMMGAMENPGCVTFNEMYVFRGRATETQLARRAETILHEMAHVYGFGDVTTMRWWGDLWLNETFATYMANLAMARATRFTNAWVDFANTVKSIAARQDQLETTHRIADDIPDTDSVRQNFDGITYHKGASVLRQLVAWVGDDAFMHGVQDYFRRYKWSNATLADFLDCLRRASGRDVSRFAHEWLQTTGMNTLRPVFTVRDGRYASFSIEQTATPAHPTLRSHHIAIGLYQRDRNGALRRRDRIDADISGAMTPISELVGQRVADLILVNEGDLTFAKLRFDECSVETLLESLSKLDDPLARALCWASLWDMTRDAEVPARRYVEIVARHLAAESEIILVERVLGQAYAAIDQFGDPDNRAVLRARLHHVTRAQLAIAAQGSDFQSAWFRYSGVTSDDPEDIDKLEALLEGRADIAGLTIDRELRWFLVGQLATTGRESVARINSEIEMDPTDIGHRRGAACLAARPSAQARKEAWTLLTEPGAVAPPDWREAVGNGISLSTMATMMLGFHIVSTPVAGFMSRGGDLELLRPYVDHYVEVLPTIWEDRSVEEAETFTELLFPRHFVDDDAVSRIERLIDSGTVPPMAVRLLREGRDGMLRARRAQEADRRAATSSSA
ncbi:MAG: aminopeptidase N [Candidatus Dormibacteraeota bacterium]|nr:aminopeptidase N [Candidatus Dormibacteraeota bacterium]